VLEEADGSEPGHPSRRRYHYAEEPLLVVDRAVASFISTDALGSPTDFTGSTGALSAKRQYDAWGQYRNGTAPTGLEPKVGYTGHQYDPETGLVYARARYYDPELGRFISRDTFEGDLADAPSLHRYAYAHGNPLVYVDEEGNAAYEVAESWEAWQRKNLWTGEQVFEWFKGGSDRFASWVAEKTGDSWFASVYGGLQVATVQTVLEVGGGVASAVTDPGLLVRGVMRFGLGFATGAEKIQQGRVLEGSLDIVAETATGAGYAGGGLGAYRGGAALVRAPGELAAQITDDVARGIQEYGAEVGRAGAPAASLAPSAGGPRAAAALGGAQAGSIAENAVGPAGAPPPAPAGTVTRAPQVQPGAALPAPTAVSAPAPGAERAPPTAPAARGAPKPSPKFEAPTNPPQPPPKATPPGWRVREMPPTEQYPNGYWRLEKPMKDGSWQPIDPSTMKPGSRSETHIPLPPKKPELP
jgi:RHS repeat-associated protein